MHTPDMELGERGYEPDHVDAVLSAIRKNFPQYWKSFASAAKDRFREAVKAWEHEHPKYIEFLDLNSLLEYEDDPNAFKGALRNRCPIIHRSLNSPAEEMKKYKRAFNQAQGPDLLTVTVNIARFGERHLREFDDATHETVPEVQELGLAELDEEAYVVYGVIGGGIRSHLLYSLHPNAFPKRSRAGVWALYFLSGRGDFGFDDDSEFLMVDGASASAQQNYHYPYDLFAFYSLKVYGMLKEACAQRKIPLSNDYRYAYLDAFFMHINNVHQADIQALRPSREDEYGD